MDLVTAIFKNLIKQGLEWRMEDLEADEFSDVYRGEIMLLNGCDNETAHRVAVKLFHYLKGEP